MEVPTWSHDPSNQLKGLTKKLPYDLKEKMDELAAMAQEMAPEHGRSTYGDPSSGLLPGDIYKEGHASTALMKAKKARQMAEHVLKELGIGL